MQGQEEVREEGKGQEIQLARETISQPKILRHHLDIKNLLKVTNTNKNKTKHRYACVWIDYIICKIIHNNDHCYYLPHAPSKNYVK